MFLFWPLLASLAILAGATRGAIKFPRLLAVREFEARHTPFDNLRPFIPP